MNHTVYARFPGPATAAAAIAELERIGAEAAVHSERLRLGELDLPDTNAMPRLITGMIAGALIGPLAVLGILYAAGATITAPALVLGAVLGGAVCGLGGILMGAAAPDQTLDRLAEEASIVEVLVTVTAPSYSLKESAEEIIRQHEGTIARRGVVTARAPEAPAPTEPTVAREPVQRWEDEGGNIPDVPTPRTDGPR
jgi:hypothetical protein